MKKHIFLVLAMFTAGSLMAAPVHVLSNKKVAQGYFPQLNADATELVYLGHETERHFANTASDMYVTNEDLKLVLYKHGTRTELYPHGTDINYICASISPNGQKILFKTSKGVGVCDLNGKPLANLGRYTAPVWYGNDYVVATLEENDGHNFTAGAVVILSVDGTFNQVLTDKAEIAMCPSVNYESGQIAYHDFEGNIHLMQINLADKAVAKRALPAIKQVEGQPMKTVRRMTNASKANFSNYKIYINPGHGGFGGDDRGMSGWFDEKTTGYIFWESQSNLDKGLQLKAWLDELGFQTAISRVLNREEDDKDLYDIVVEANTFGADFMLSIHTNAGGPSNYVLQLYSGWNPGDTHSYSHKVTEENNRIGRELTTMMGNNQYSNQLSNWTAQPRIEGDKTFARTAMGWSNGYGVLRWLTVPGTISEGAMHDYFPETYRLMNMDYKHQEAWNFMKTFCTYYCSYELPKGVIAGQVRDAYRKQTFPDIRRIKNTHDEQLPINKATVELLKGGEVIKTYITDTCYNGVFFFWDLEPGDYAVRVPKGQYELRVPTISADQSYFYGKEANVTVKANEIAYVDMMLDAQRSTAPEVISYSPNVAITDSMDVTTNVVLNFNWDMKDVETEAAFSISPAVEGSIVWENSYRTLRFVPTTKFEKGMEYTVTLTTEACHPDTNWTNHMQKPFTFKFRTKNRAEITMMQSYPEVNQTNIPVNPSFILLFDEKITTTSANKKLISVVDAKGVEQKINNLSFDMNKRTQGAVIFETTNALEPDAEYKVVIKPDFKDVTGVTLGKTIEIPFRTSAITEGEGEVVDNFETGSFRFDEEATIGATGTTQVFPNKKLFELASNQLRYTFTEPDGYITYAYLNPSALTANGNCKMGMYVFGDCSHNELVALWSDAGDIKYASLGVIDFAGWKYLTADMSELPENVAYQFMGLRIKRSTNLLSASGYLCVDNMMFVSAPTALEDVEVENLGVQKVVENDQLIIIKDGVHYNVLGTVIE